MNGLMIFGLIGTTLLPVLLAFVFYLLIKKSHAFNKLNFWWQQIIIGVVFAIAAICAFAFGFEYEPIEGYADQTIVGTYGCANAIPIIASFIFGWPSGIIAGLGGGLYRLFITPFGVGDYLRGAEAGCVFFVGLVAAALRYWLFDNKKPKWFTGIIAGIFAEVIHMLGIFLVGFAQRDVVYAYGIIRQCDYVCAITVVASIIISLIIISVLEKESIRFNRNDRHISTKIQRWMWLSFGIALLTTIAFTYLAYYAKSTRDVDTNLYNYIWDCQRELQDGPVGQKDKKWSDAELERIAWNRRIGEEGYLLITDANRDDLIVSLPCDMPGYVRKYNFSFSDGKKISDYETDNTFISFVRDPVSGKNYKFVVRYTKVIKTNTNESFNVIGVIGYYEARQALGLSVRVTSYLELLVFVAIYSITYIFIKKVVVSNIVKINQSLKLIKSGNLNIKVDVRSNEEFASLSDDINRTVEILKKYIDEANKRIDAELAFAKDIQHSSLPYIFPVSKHFDLAASMNTAKEVGGDFYDFFMLRHNRFMFSIADVSGKGIPAAMFMMRAKTLIKSLVESGDLKLNEIIMRANDELCSANDARMFVTGWFGIVDLETGLLEFVNAGHNPPCIRHKGKQYEELKMKKNLVLAGMEGVHYDLQTIQLQKGDEIFLYTDGVTEAVNVNKELYTLPRLLKLFENMKYQNSSELINQVQNDIDLFQAGTSQADDITMLSFRYYPTVKIYSDELVIRADVPSIRLAIAFINKLFDRFKTGSRIKSYAAICINEIINNIINNSYSGITKGNIKITYQFKNDKVTISFIDDGIPYNMFEQLSKLKRKKTPIDESKISALGVLYVKTKAKDITYRRHKQQNIITFVKNLK